MSRRSGSLLAILVCICPLVGCGPRDGGAKNPLPADTLSRMERLEGVLGVLASDSLEGRGTATRGSAMAADFIAKKLEEYGASPAFGESYFQTVELVRFRDAQGRERMGLGPAEDLAGVEVLETLTDVNVGGVLWGEDRGDTGEVVVVSAHFDHLGVRAPRPGTPAEAEGDSIYNGADDDGTGVAAVLEIARSLAQDGPTPRTVLFLLITGEERGILGTRWYVQHPAFPLDRTVADLNVEMLGRPGPNYGGEGKGWITGYDRSTMGQIFTDAGLSVMPDPFPDRGLFFGSDNIGFAMEGVVAHTVSSSDLHDDYHTPDDEIDRIDFQSMTQVVETLIQATRLLADGATPVWNEGGRPEPRGGGGSS